MLEGVLDGYSHNNKSGHPSFPFIPLKEESITVLSYLLVGAYAVKTIPAWNNPIYVEIYMLIGEKMTDIK